jgi:hypothetical protein
MAMQGTGKTMGGREEEKPELRNQKFEIRNPKSKI